MTTEIRIDAGDSLVDTSRDNPERRIRLELPERVSGSGAPGS